MDSLSVVFEVPPAIRRLLNAGEAERIGSVIRQKKPSRILAHLREVGDWPRHFGSPPHLASKLEALQLLSTAASVLNLGVSVLGFEAVLSRLQEIDARLQQVVELQRKTLEAVQGIDSLLQARERSLLFSALEQAAATTLMKSRKRAQRDLEDARRRMLTSRRFYAERLRENLESWAFKAPRVLVEAMSFLAVAGAAETRTLLQLEEIPLAYHTIRSGVCGVQAAAQTALRASERVRAPGISPQGALHSLAAIRLPGGDRPQALRPGQGHGPAAEAADNLPPVEGPDLAVQEARFGADPRQLKGRPGLDVRGRRDCTEDGFPWGRRSPHPREAVGKWRLIGAEADEDAFSHNSVVKALADAIQEAPGGQKPLGKRETAVILLEEGLQVVVEDSPERAAEEVAPAVAAARGRERRGQGAFSGRRMTGRSESLCRRFLCSARSAPAGQPVRPPGPREPTGRAPPWRPRPRLRAGPSRRGRPAAGGARAGGRRRGRGACPRCRRCPPSSVCRRPRQVALGVGMGTESLRISSGMKRAEVTKRQTVRMSRP